MTKLTRTGPADARGAASIASVNVPDRLTELTDGTVRSVDAATGGNRSISEIPAEAERTCRACGHQALRGVMARVGGQVVSISNAPSAVSPLSPSREGIVIRPGRLFTMRDENRVTDEELRRQTRSRLLDGRLPIVHGVSRSRRGTGRPCIVCRRMIAPTEVECQAGGLGVFLFAHEVCYKLWHDESVARRAAVDLKGQRRLVEGDEP